MGTGMGMGRDGYDGGYPGPHEARRRRRRRQRRQAHCDRDWQRGVFHRECAHAGGDDGVVAKPRRQAHRLRCHGTADKHVAGRIGRVKDEQRVRRSAGRRRGHRGVVARRRRVGERREVGFESRDKLPGVRVRQQRRVERNGVRRACRRIVDVNGLGRVDAERQWRRAVGQKHIRDDVEWRYAKGRGGRRADRGRRHKRTDDLQAGRSRDAAVLEQGRGR
eukprot:365499-Chlamydomonas_euryale.AAC.5